MAENTKENVRDWAKFPWQKAIIVLLAAISAMFGLREKTSAERLNNWKTSYERLEVAYKDAQQRENDCYKERAAYSERKADAADSLLKEPMKELIKTIKKR